MQHFVEPENQSPPAESASLFDPGSTTDRPSRSPAGAPASLDERETWLCELASLLVERDDMTSRLSRALRIGGLLVPAVRRWCVYAAGPRDETVMLLDVQDGQISQTPAAAASRGKGTLGFGAAVDRRVLVERQEALVQQSSSSLAEHVAPPASTTGRTRIVGACFPLVSSEGRLNGVLVVTPQSGAALTIADLAVLRTVSFYATVMLSQRVPQRVAPQLAPQPSASDEREAFISLAAHELRSPLTSVKGYAQLLLRGARKDPVYPENNLRALLAIEQQASRMSDMVAEMLDASRIMRGALELHLRPTDLNALAQRVVDQRRLVLERHDVRLETDDSGLVGRWDAQRVEQVIRDLLDNAIRYSPNGGTVNMRLTRVNNLARLCVDDEGIGVDAEERDRIFQSFYRGQMAQRRNLSGLGLGLFVSRTIAEALGGRVWLQPPDPDRQGSEFCLELPLAI